MIRSWLRNRRGAVALEVVLGVVMLVMLTDLGFGLYRQAETSANLRRIAATYADYASRDKDPSATEIQALVEFLHKTRLDPLHAAFVLVAVEKAPDDIPTALWVVGHLITPGAVQVDPDLNQCSRILTDTVTMAATLPSVFTMEDNEVIISAEVCVKRNGDLLYDHSIMPARAGSPAEPV